MYFWRKFDLVGIVLQIMGSSTPPFYYGFYCEESRYYRNLYLYGGWAVCILAGVVVLFPFGLKMQHRAYLCAVAFIFAGWSTLPGCMHLAWNRDPRLMYEW
jgi:predicted membrane channel-forming protein YqfA (hemolysin III family)